VLFTITAPTGGLANSQVAVLDLTTGKYKTVLRGGHHAHYVPTGHLVYGASGTLRAVPFDLARLEVSGPPVPILDNVATTFEGGIDVAITPSGTLVYVPGSGAIGPARSLVWVDRMGREEPLRAPLRAYNYLRLSPDGTRVALDIRDQDQDVWIWDIARRTMTRLTFDPALDLFPVWTPDSRRILFSSTRSGPADIYWQSADGTGMADRLTQSANQQIPASTSPDGKGIVVLEVAAQTGRDLIWLPLAAGAAERSSSHPLIRTMFAEANGEISPDGHWLAYQSNEPGRNEIYVQPFPDVTAGRWQVSSGGGATPVWARTGQELFYRSLDGAVMAVRVEPGPGWRSGPPTQIVPPRYFDLPGAFSRTFDVAPDGRRFVMIKEGAGDAAATPQNLVVVQHWFEDLKRLVPTN
jgi:serine/threonine-protein kinase